MFLPNDFAYSIFNADLCDYRNRWDNIWPRNTKQQQQQQTDPSSIFGGHPTSTFNLQFPSPVARQRRSNSLTPPVAAHHLDVVDRTNNTSSTNRHKPRSFSVSGDHAGNLISTYKIIESMIMSSQFFFSQCEKESLNIFFLVE